MKKGKWFGADRSNEVNLCDNGLLMRRSGVMYEVIVWLGTGYAYGLFDDKQLIEDLDDNIGKTESSFPSWDSLTKVAGEKNTKEYRNFLLKDCIRDYRALVLLSDMNSCYGIQDAVSLDYRCHIYTENEIRKRLNKAIR